MISDLRSQISKLHLQISGDSDSITKETLTDTANHLTERLIDIQVIQTYKKRFEAEMRRIIELLGTWKTRVVRVGREGADMGEAQDINMLLSDLSKSVKVGESVTAELRAIRVQASPEARDTSGTPLYIRHKDLWQKTAK